MQTKQSLDSVQAHLEQFFSRLANCPELEGQLSPADLPQLLEAGLAHVLHTTLCKERELHLEDHPEDRANGYAPVRSLKVGNTSVQLDRPRTRQAFYPAVLPKHQRHLPEAYQQLLRNILLGARSFSAARRTLQALGLGYSPEQVEQLLEELHQEARNFFTRPLNPDWLCLFIDAKLIELKDEHEQVKQAVHFLVVGLGLDGKKEVLTACTFWGNEVLEAWRKVLVDLKNRGLVRVLLLVTDDFSGLGPLIKGLFPFSDHQLCTVHLLRNAQRHLSLEDYALFRESWREIQSASSFESAQTKFRALLEQLRPQNRAYVEHLEKRVANYLAFIKYPTPGPSPAAFDQSARGHQQSNRKPPPQRRRPLPFSARSPHQNETPNQRPLRLQVVPRQPGVARSFGFTQPDVPPAFRSGTQPRNIPDTKFLTTTTGADRVPRLCC